MAQLYRRPRSPFYYARIGDRRVSTGERTRAGAQCKADALEKEQVRLTGKPGDLHLVAAAERFFAARDLRPSTVRDYKHALVSYYGVFGDFPLKALDLAMIRSYVEARLQETSSIMVRRELAFLSSLYTAARHWPGGPVDNPVKGYSRKGLKDARARTRWLTGDEVDRLLAACTEPHQWAFIILAVDTGMRSGEIRDLRWSEIDLRNREIVLSGDRTKNRDYRLIPMTARVCDLLERTHASVPGEYVLTNPKTGKPYTSFKTGWRALCRRARVGDARIHDLRHTFASWSLQRGIDSITVQHLLGHKTASMTRRYAKPSRETLHGAIAKLVGSTQTDTQATKKFVGKKETLEDQEVTDQAGLAQLVEHLICNPGTNSRIGTVFQANHLKIQVTFSFPDDDSSIV